MKQIVYRFFGFFFLLLLSGCSSLLDRGAGEQILAIKEVSVNSSRYTIIESQTNTKPPIGTQIEAMIDGNKMVLDWAELGFRTPGSVEIKVFAEQTDDHRTDDVVSSWKQDERSTQLLETDVYYLSFIPEKHDVIVGVMGTGIDIDLPMFDGFIYTNPYEIDGNGVDDDFNGVVDDVHGASFLYEGENTRREDFVVVSSNVVEDDSDHETRVASIIASKQMPGVNFRGISDTPGKIKLVPIKVKQYTYDFWDLTHLAAMKYAISVLGVNSVGVDIINASFGDKVHFSYNPIDDEYKKFFSIGKIVVAAAGNVPYSFTQEPCEYSDSICVGGLKTQSEIWDRTSWGTTDFVSYAEQIYHRGKEGLMRYGSGTSYAAPIISGAVAKIIAYSGNRNRAYAYSLLEKHAVDMGDPDDRDGLGYIDFKGLAEEFVEFSTYLVKLNDMQLEFLVAKDRETDLVCRAELRYIYQDDVRYSVHQVISPISLDGYF